MASVRRSYRQEWSVARKGRAGGLRRTGWVLLTGLLLAPLILTGAEPPPPAGPDPDHLPSVWAATGDGLLKIDAASGDELARIAHPPQGLDAMTVDRTRGRLWATIDAMLHAYDLSGAPVLETDLTERGGGPAGAPIALAVDESSGDVYRLEARRLLRIGGDGILREVIGFDDAEDDAAALALADHGTAVRVWVAAGTRLNAFDRDGGEAATLETARPVQALAWDAVSDTLYFADDERVHRHRPGKGSEDGEPIAFDQAIALLPDEAGGLWIASHVRLAHADASGTLSHELHLPPEIQGTLRGAAGDAAGGVWLAGAKRLRHVDEGGALAREVDPDGRPPLHDLAFYVDRVPPLLTVVAPPSGIWTNDPRIEMRLEWHDEGIGVDPATLEARIVGDGGEPLALDCDVSAGQALCRPVEAFADGAWSIDFTIADFAGNRSAPAALDLNVDTVPPQVPEAGRIDVVLNDDGTATVSGTDGAVEAHGLVTVTNTATGARVTVSADAQGAFTATIAAEAGEQLSISVADAAGNVSEALQHELAPAIPPDPATIAPPPEPGVGNSLMRLESFLFEDSNPIQRGVDPTVFEERRFAVIRGRVTDADGEPLEGVTVRVLHHPQYGHTRTRSDGEYDLAVNGGGPVTLEFTRSGLLPAQRRLRVPWRDYVHAEEVALIGLDERLTVVDLTNGVDMQVARGSRVSDADGARQATVMFPAGTTATIVDAEGAERSLERLGFRATEYTVGERGPQMMPAPLPPTSGYTYAVELSVDEALAAGAERVAFDRPVPLYLENFLGFPTGAAVPAGFHDRALGQWIPADDGRVIEILAIEGGRAVLDVSGEGPATQEALDAMGIAPAELERLAGLYEAGETLWRVPLDHFSAWDLNYPFGPPDGAVPPPGPERAPETPEDEQDELCGSIVSAQDCALAEALPVAGTPLRLRYDSRRQHGMANPRRIRVPLSGETVPAQLERIDVTVTVAGRRIERSFEPEANQTWTFVWDGLDVRGRALDEPVRATVRVDYVYPMLYFVPPWLQGQRSFAAPPEEIVLTGDGRFTFGETALSRVTEALLFAGVPRVAQSAALGGWTLDLHHAYTDQHRFADLLQRGDGRDAPARAATIDTVAGTGERGFSGDGGPATEARLENPGGVALGPDGALYIADTGNHRVRRVAPDGVMDTFAGTGTAGFGGDGGPATEARFNVPMGVDVAADGAVHVVDMLNRRVRRVNASGIVETVAGTGELGFSGDGGPATEAELRNPWGIAVGPDGSFYVGDRLNGRVRQVRPDGTIDTIAAGFDSLRGLAVGPEGAVYFADWRSHRLRRITPDGRIETVAGTGVTVFDGDFGGDGGPAGEAALDVPSGVAVDADGKVFIADTNNRRVRRVRSVGAVRVIDTLAGSGERGFSGDGGPAVAASLGDPGDVAVSPDGSVYVADRSRHVVRRIRFASPPVTDGLRHVASRDGEEVYAFDDRGRHVATHDALTGALRWGFDYDNANRLVSITDAEDNETRIERVGGRPTAIVAPDGQRTGLTVDEEGRLTAVTDPEGGTWQLAYDEGALLTRLTHPGGAVTEYGYDEAGRLVVSRDAEGGGWTLDRSEAAASTETVMESAAARVQRFQTVAESGGGRRHVHTRSDGLESVRLRRPRRGLSELSHPDGTVTVLEEGADPRFGMRAPVAARLSVTTPGDRSLTRHLEREVVPAELDDPLSAERLIETVTIGGDEWVRDFRADPATQLETSPEGRVVRRELDDLGRVTRVRHGGLAPWHFERDARGRLVEARQGEGEHARVTLFSYGDDGFLARVTNALGRSVEMSHDAAGRLTRQVLPDGSEIGLEWDADGRMRALTPPGGETHRFDYTGVGLEARYEPPELAGIETVTRQLWNPDRQLTRIDRPDGKALVLDYDVAGRLVAHGTPLGTTTFEYDPATGHLSRLTDATGGSLEYAHDGFLLLSERWHGEVAATVARDYDDRLRMSTLTVGLETIPIEYDRDDLIVRAGELELHRDEGTGLITATALGPLTTEERHDAFAEPEHFSASHADAELYRAEYERDALGRIVERIETLDGESRSERYEYDARGRLHRVYRNGALAAVYGYDANGNRLARNGTTGSYDAQDRLMRWGETHYAYTQAGELKETIGPDGTTGYDYDIAGNLRAVTRPDGTVIDYLIDARDRRIGKRIDGELKWGLVYRDQLNPVARMDADGLMDQVYIYGSRSHVPDYLIDPRDGARYRLITDQLGSVRLVVNVETGAVVQRIDYDEFGRVLADSQPGFQPFGFAGGLHDPDTGLVRFGARDYDPETGRWTSKDPIGFAGGDTNLYGYAWNDPVNVIDPSGRFGLLGAGVGAIIGGVSGGIGTFVTTGSVGDAAVGAITGAATGAVAGVLPGASFLPAVGFGGGLAGASNFAAQFTGIVRSPCLSGTNFNFGSFLGAIIGGSVSAMIRLPAGRSTAADAAFAPVDVGISATATGIGARLGER